MVASLIVLGAAWPSFFTIAAIAVLPAFFVCAVGVFKPSIADKSKALNVYLAFAALTSVVSWFLVLE
jgi:hypothetical protein